ncbi:hypothetical protein TcCL_NonESM10845 [Trypanosoma cruzi]|nr:hypothetical protein TcCL_NonESM10845 [Trypanosoma cruzi]
MVGDAPRHCASGSRDIPTGICTDGMEQAECVAAAACHELKCSANGRTAIMPSAVASPCCQRSVRNSLVSSRSHACDAPRHGGATSLPSGIGCAAVLLGPLLCPASAGTSSRSEHRHPLPSNKRLIDVLLPTPQHTGTRPADHRQPSVLVPLLLLSVKGQDCPDLLRNLHLACRRHLLVERRAADQRRPAQAAAASSRLPTI